MSAFEHLDEIRGRNVPHASLALLRERIDGIDAAVAAATPEQVQALDEYLAHFAWLTRERADGEAEVLCPGCETRGFFGWGLVHGAGYCRCGWPGRLYHRVDLVGVRLDMLLWAHPDEVGVTKKAKR